MPLFIPPGISSGDMLRSAYDTNNDGVVNQADLATLANQSYTQVSNAVANAAIAVDVCLVLDGGTLRIADPYNPEHAKGFVGVARVSGAAGGGIDFTASGFHQPATSLLGGPYFIGANGVLSSTPAPNAAWILQVGYGTKGGGLFVEPGLPLVRVASSAKENTYITWNPDTLTWDQLLATARGGTDITGAPLFPLTIISTNEAGLIDWSLLPEVTIQAICGEAIFDNAWVNLTLVGTVVTAYLARADRFSIDGGTTYINRPANGFAPTGAASGVPIVIKINPQVITADFPVNASGGLLDLGVNTSWYLALGNGTPSAAGCMSGVPSPNGGLGCILQELGRSIGPQEIQTVGSGRRSFSTNLYAAKTGTVWPTVVNNSGVTTQPNPASIASGGFILDPRSCTWGPGSRHVVGTSRVERWKHPLKTTAANFSSNTQALIAEQLYLFPWDSQMGHQIDGFKLVTTTTASGNLRFVVYKDVITAFAVSSGVYTDPYPGAKIYDSNDIALGAAGTYSIGTLGTSLLTLDPNSRYWIGVWVSSGTPPTVKSIPAASVVLPDLDVGSSLDGLPGVGWQIANTIAPATTAPSGGSIITASAGAIPAVGFHLMS